MSYFANEDGFNLSSIPESYLDHYEMEDLVDIRENSAYIAFVSMIGGYINFEENGYDILAKEYKRELKYAAGNIMKLHMRAYIDRSVETLVNFFIGFPSIKAFMKNLSGQKLREIRVMITVDRRQIKMKIENERKRKEEE